MKNPRVQVKPRLFRKTAAKRLRCVPVPFAGAVLTGTGAVRTLPTRTVPVRNPILLHPANYGLHLNLHPHCHHPSCPPQLSDHHLHPLPPPHLMLPQKSFLN